jgi:sugar phosphate isomerase/epimerase
MKLTVTSWSFAACSLKESWAIARALGFEAMDLGLLHGAALNRGRIVSDPVGAAAGVAGLGIKASNLYWLFGADIAENAVTDPAAKARNEAELDQVCRFATTLKCPSIFILPGVQRPGVPKVTAVTSAVDGLRGLVDVAARHGVTLTVEPHVGGLLSSPGETLNLLAAVPGLRLTLDYAHFACIGFTQAEIDVLAPFAAHVHMRQARPGALQAKWGEGTLDFTAMVGRLADTGYDGYLSVEYVHQGYMNTLFDDVLTETVRMRDHLRACGAT